MSLYSSNLGSNANSPQPSTASNRDRIRLKCRYDGEIRTVVINPSTTITDLKRRLASDFGFEVVLKYEDRDGDLITLSTQNDLNDLFLYDNHATNSDTINVIVSESTSLPQLNIKNNNQNGRGNNISSSSNAPYPILSASRDWSARGGNHHHQNNFGGQPTPSSSLAMPRLSAHNPGTATSSSRYERFPSINEYNNSRYHQENTSIRWKKGEMLGQGAFGVVYLGLNIDTGELMAVKQMATEEVSKKELASLENEINLLRNLRHPNIVRYIGTELTSASLSIFLEYVPGGSLKALIDKFGELEESVAKSYTRQLLLGLEYLHRNGIAHRDIKGANCLVGNDGVIKLADFGSSKHWRPNSPTAAGVVNPTQSGDIKGTPAWMAPEVIRDQGGNINWKKADIWSLACTTLEMTTGKAPWSQFNNSVTILYHIACQDTLPEYPSPASTELITFLNICFQRDPLHRPDVTSLLLHPFVSGASSNFGGLVRPSTVSSMMMNNSDDGYFSSNFGRSSVSNLGMGTFRRHHSEEKSNESHAPPIGQSLNRPMSIDTASSSFPEVGGTRSRKSSIQHQQPPILNVPNNGQQIHPPSIALPNSVPLSLSPRANGMHYIPNNDMLVPNTARSALSLNSVGTGTSTPSMMVTNHNSHQISSSTHPDDDLTQDITPRMGNGYLARQRNNRLSSNSGTQDILADEDRSVISALTNIPNPESTHEVAESVASMSRHAETSSPTDGYLSDFTSASLEGPHPSTADIPTHHLSSIQEAIPLPIPTTAPATMIPPLDSASMAQISSKKKPPKKGKQKKSSGGGNAPSNSSVGTPSNPNGQNSSKRDRASSLNVAEQSIEIIPSASIQPKGSKGSQVRRRLASEDSISTIGMKTVASSMNDMNSVKQADGSPIAGYAKRKGAGGASIASYYDSDDASYSLNPWQSVNDLDMDNMVGALEDDLINLNAQGNSNSLEIMSVTGSMIPPSLSLDEKLIIGDVAHVLDVHTPWEKDDISIATGENLRNLHYKSEMNWPDDHTIDSQSLKYPAEIVKTAEPIIHEKESSKTLSLDPVSLRASTSNAKLALAKERNSDASQHRGEVQSAKPSRASKQSTSKLVANDGGNSPIVHRTTRNNKRRDHSASHNNHPTLGLASANTPVGGEGSELLELSCDSLESLHIAGTQVNTSIHKFPNMKGLEHPLHSSQVSSSLEKRRPVGIILDPDEIIQVNDEYEASLARRGERRGNDLLDDEMNLHQERSLHTVDPVVLDEHSGAITRLKYPRRAGFLLSASTDGTVRMWAPNETNSRAVLDAVNFTVVSNSTSISGAAERKISLGSKTPGGNIADEVVDFENPQLQSSLTNVPNNSTTTTTVSTKTGKVFNLWSDENCETIWASCLDGNIRIWNGLEGRPIRMLKGHEEAITCLEGLDPYNLGYSSSSVLVATGSVDRTIRMWDLRTKKNQVFVFRGHGDNILALRWSESGRALISGSKDKTIRIWDTRAGRLRTTIEKHFGSVHALRVIPDMTFSHPATAGGNNTSSSQANATVTNTTANSKLHEQVAFVSAGRDSMINFWNANGDCISSQTAHRGYVSYLSDINYSTMNLRPTSANTSLLMLSVGSDNIIKLWDVKRCKCLSEITPTMTSIANTAGVSGAPGGGSVANASSTPSANSTITKTTWCTGSSFVTASSNGQLRVFERTFDHYQNQPTTSHGLGNSITNGDNQLPLSVPTRGNTNSIEWSSQDLPSHSSSCTDIITASNLLACGSKSGRILRWDW